VSQLLFSGAGLLVQVCAGELAGPAAVTALAVIVALLILREIWAHMSVCVLFPSSHFIVSIFGR